MKAVVLKRHGGPAVLRVSQMPDPTPGPGQVAVRVKTIGLNFAEVLSRKGLYGWAPPIWKPLVRSLPWALERSGAWARR